MLTRLAKIVSIIFHPILVPTFGLFFLFNSGFYIGMLSWEAKRFIILVVLFSTGILPLLSVAILALNPNFDLSMSKSRDRVIPLLSSSVCYYLGFMLLNKMRVYPVFKLFMIASVLVIIALLLISFKWKISNHMAAIGGLSGTLLALSFRTGVNPLWSILTLVVVSGLVGTARLILEKHSLLQLIAGYCLGFIVLYLVVYFV